VGNETSDGKASSKDSSKEDKGTSGSGTSDEKKTPKYSSEWIDGKWYESDGSQKYTATGKWMSDGGGWWFEDSSGWYPKSTWQRIDGRWYYFTDNGYMDYSEYRDGCWLGADGAWDENYGSGTWHSNSVGWWFTDGDWYPAGQWLWINGVNYYFNSSGYLEM